jgi:hypothetical protein
MPLLSTARRPRAARPGFAAVVLAVASTVAAPLTPRAAAQPADAQASGTHADEFDPELRPFAELVRKCERYRDLVSSSEWKPVWRESFDKEAEGRWSLRAPTAEDLQTNQVKAGDVAQIRQYEGRGVLWLDVQRFESGLVAIGPKVSGDFAVEVVAASVGERQCDLSIVCDGVGRAPGYQFGGYDNTRNTLWVGDRSGEQPAEKAAQQGPRNVEIENGPTIEPGKFHRIRLEVSGGAVRGFVDGKPVGQAALAPGYDAKLRRQPLFYIYTSVAALDEATVYTPEPSPKRMTPEQAFAEAFGEFTPAQLDREMAALAEQLGAARWSTREQAQVLLRRAGRLAVRAVQEAAESGSAERRERAGALLTELKASPAIEMPK